MKFLPLTIQNLKIATYHSDGKSIPIVFIHSISIGAASFYKQMMSKEAEDIHFISIDLPGHGASDFSFQPKIYYQFDKLTELLVETIKQLKLKEFIIAGHFTGAHLALNVLNYFDNIKAALLFGFAPLENYKNLQSSYKTDTEYFDLFFKPKMDTEDAARVAQLYFSNDNAADISFVDNIKNTDPNFRYIFAESFINCKHNDYKIIKNSKVPLCIVSGSDDKIIKLEKINEIKDYLWRKKVQVISNSGNAVMWENNKIFNYFIKEFINDLNK